MQVIGLCRFSYPAEGGFQVEHDSTAARSSYLYSPSRMEERFRHFETISLPGVRAQTDGDFTLLMLIGDDLPRPYLERLMDQVSGVPQITVVARPPGLNHRKVCQEVINVAREDADHSVSLQFRHDDDDGLSVRFIERFRKAYDDVQPLMNDARLLAIDFNRGFIARPDAQGICAEENVTPYYGVALGMIVRPWVSQTIMNFSHNKLARNMPTVTFTDEPMWVRGHNDHNDSRQKKHIRRPDLPRLDQLGEDLFRETFNICSDHVRRVFSA